MCRPRDERRLRWAWLYALLAAVLSPMVPSVLRADWGQYRHDAAHTGCADDPAVPPLELRWKQTDCPNGQCDCQPPPALYAYDGDLYFRRSTVGLVRLDGETGEVVWQKQGFPPDYLVAVDSGAIIATNRSGPVVRRNEALWSAWIDAYDVETGVRAWRLVHPEDLPGFTWTCYGPTAPDGPDVRTGHWEAAGCLVREGKLCAVGMPLIGRGKYEGEYEACLYMVDIAEGRVSGRSTCNPGRTEPLIAPGAILPQDPGFYEAEVTPYRDWFRLRAWGDKLLLLSHYERRLSGRALVAGPWAVSSDAVLAMTPEDVPADPWWPPAQWPSVALAERAGVALGYTGLNNRAPSRLTARHASSGQLLWARPLLSEPAHGPPAVDDETAYFGLADGYVYALDLLTGEPKWATKVEPPPPDPDGPPPDRIYAPSAPVCSLSGEIVWVGHHGQLLALDAETGETKWQTDQTQALEYEPVVDNGWVYLLTPFGVEAWGPPTKDEKTEPKEGKLTEDSAAQ